MDEHVELENRLAGRWQDNSTDGEGVFTDSQCFSNGVLLTEKSVGILLRDEGMVGSGKLGSTCHQRIVEHLQEAGVRCNEVHHIILFVVRHFFVGSKGQRSTSHDLVVRDEGSVTVCCGRYACCNLDVTDRYDNPFSIYTMGIHRPFAVKVADKDDATGQAECQA